MLSFRPPDLRSDMNRQTSAYRPFCLLLSVITVTVFPVPPRAAQAEVASSVRSGSLGTGTTWETPWYVIDSGREGPAVLITGGVHGIELRFGFRAAEQIRHWPVKRGKLIVLPQINRLGLDAKMRWSPDHRNDRQRRDINRSFPTADSDEALTQHTQAVVGVYRPATARLGL